MRGGLFTMISRIGISEESGVLRSQETAERVTLSGLHSRLHAHPAHILWSWFLGLQTHNKSRSTLTTTCLN